MARKMQYLAAIWLLSTCLPASAQKEYSFISPSDPKLVTVGANSYSSRGEEIPTLPCSSDAFECMSVNGIEIGILKQGISRSWSFRGNTYCAFNVQSTESLGRVAQVYVKDGGGECDYIRDDWKIVFIYSCEFGLRYLETYDGRGAQVRLFSVDEHGFAASLPKNGVCKIKGNGEN